MKLEPRKGWIVGRVAITKASDVIVAADPNKGVTKFIFVEAVSPEAEEDGISVGDLVMPEAMSNIFLKGGAYHRVTVHMDKVLCKVADVPLSEFVGTDGKPFKVEEVAA